MEDKKSKRISGKDHSVKIPEIEKLFSAAYQISPLAVILTRASNGLVIDINNACLGLLGYSREEVVGHTTQELNLYPVPGDRDRLINKLKADGKLLYEEAGFRKKSGETGTLLVSAELIDSDGDMLLLSMMADISDRKRLEAKLSESEQWHTHLFRKLDIPVILMKLPEVVIIDANEATEKLTGYKREELIGRSSVELGLISEQQRQGIFTDFNNSQTLTDNEILIKTRSGEERIITVNSNRLEINGKPYVLSSAVDITERKQAEFRVQASERALKLFIEFSPASIAMFDRNMKYIAASRRYISDYRLKYTDITGRSHYEVFPEIPERWKEIHRRCLTGIIEKADEDQFPRADGTIDWVHWEIHPWYEKPGEVGGLILFSEVITERKMILDQLRQSEESFKGLFEQNAVPMWVYDPETLAFLAVNDAAVEHYGYEREVFLSMTLKDIRPEEDLGKLKESVKQRNTAYQMSGPWRHLKKDGSVILVDLASHLITWQGKPGIIVVAFDQTAQILAEEALGASEIRFRELAQNIQEVFWVYDHVERRIVYISPAYEKTWGRTVESLYHDSGSYIASIHPEDKPEMFRALESQAQGEPTTVEYRIIRPDKSIRWIWDRSVPIIEQGRLIRSIGVASDITARIKAEEQTINTERRYRSLIENAPDGIVLINTEGKFLYASPSVERIFGYKKEDISNYDAAGLTHPDDLPMILSELGKLLSDPAYIPTLQYRFKHKNSEWRWIESTFSNLLTVPDVGAIIINFRDIHERRLAEEDLEKSQGLLMEAQRVGHIGHMEWNGKGKPLVCSDELYRILGLEPQSIPISQNLVGTMVAKEEEQRLRRLDKEFFTSRSDIDYEFYITLPSGEKRWLHQHGKVTYSEEGKPVHMISTVQDITERKHAEIIIRESEEKYRGLINNMNDTIWLIDYDMSIIDINQTATTMLGYSREELLSMKIPEIDVNLTPGKIQDLVSSMPDDKMQVFQTAHRTKDGRAIPVEVSSSLVSFSGRTVILSIARDITERKRSEKALQESEEKFRKAFVTSPEAININRLSDGLYVAINNGFTQIMGYSEEEVLGKKSLEISIWEDPEDRKRLVGLLMNDGFAENLEARFRKKNGDFTYGLMSASVLMLDNVPHILSITRDISKRKQAEERLRRVLETTSDGFWTVDSERRFLEVNDAYCSMSGYSRQEILQMRITDIEAVEREEETNEHISKIMREGGDTFDTRHRRKDGTVFDVEVSVNILDREHGIMICFCRDITSRKQAEEQLRESEIRFRSLYENATIGMYRTSPDGHILLANPALVRMLGYSDFEELSSRDLEREGYEPSYKRSTFRALMEQEGEVRGYEVAWNRKDGTSLFIRESAKTVRDDKGRIIYYEGTVEDITESKLAHEALMKSEEKYHLLFERVKNGYSLNEILVDSEGNAIDYLIVEVNYEFEKIFGRKREELISKKGSELKPGKGKDWQERLRIVRDAANEGKEGEFEYHQNETGRFYNVHVYSPGKNFFAAIYEDITERKNIEGALKKVEDKYFALFNSQTDITLLAEISDRGIPGKIIEANDHAVKITGYSKEELLLMNPADLSVYPLSNSESVARQLLVGNTARIEQIVRCRDGREFPAEILVYKILSGDRTFAIIAAHDITEIKKAEKEAEESRRLMNTLLTNVPLGVTIADSEMNIIWSSQAGKMIPWLTINENIKTAFRPGSLFYAGTMDPVPFHELPIVKAVRNDTLVENMEVSLMNADGSSADLSCNAVSVKNSDGEIIGGIMTYQDITSRKRKEEEIYSLNSLLVKRTEELESSNKELEAFSYSVSHDLRAPLRHISAFTSLLSEKFEGKLDEEGEDFLNRVYESANVMSNLIDDLLKLSRVTMAELNVERVSLSELFSSVSSEKQKEHPGRKVKIVVGEDLYANCDPSLMRICFNNLFENAWKFTGRSTEPLIEFGEEQSNGKTSFFIRDNGVGFDMQHSNKLFGAFQRLHSASEFEGTGIGLAIVKRIISKHGGNIWAESELNKGTTFYFILNN